MAKVYIHTEHRDGRLTVEKEWETKLHCDPKEEIREVIEELTAQIYRAYGIDTSDNSNTEMPSPTMPLHLQTG